MDVHCPLDQHFRTLDRLSGQLSCQHRECQCGECRRWLSPAEQRDWRGQ